MNSPFLTLLDLIYPFLLGFAVLTLQCFLKKAENDITKFQFSVFGIVTFESALRKLWIVRLCLLLIAVGLFALSAFRDYASFFPSHMQMEVFFDDEGIEKALNQFNEKELSEVDLAADWQAQRIQYIESLNKVLQSINHPFRFDCRKNAVRTQGENYIEIRKVQSWGWQEYKIERGRGSVTHTYEVPGQSPQTISSSFDLLESDANYLNLSLSDIYWGWTKVIKPEYKQIFRKTQTDVFYSHNLISLTKVRFFPYLDIGKSVYLARDPSSNKFIPVGYAIYYPD